MTIKIACQCGKRFAVQSRLEGKRIKCPSCSATMTVPAQPVSTALPTMDTDEITNTDVASKQAKFASVNCKCGAKLRIKQDLAGQSLKCPKCGSSITGTAPKQDAVANQGLANWFDDQLPDVPLVTAPEVTTHLRTQPASDGQQGPRCSKCNGTLFPLSIFGGERHCGRCEIDVYLVNSQNCISSGWLLRAGRNEPGHDRERIKDFRLLIMDAAETVRESSEESSRYSRRFGGTTIIELILWNFLSTNVHRRELRHMKLLLSLLHKQTGYEFATWAENPSRWISFLTTFRWRA
jgi:hypothetical protein